MSVKNGRGATFHFHVARKTREKYGFSRELFTASGNAVFTDLRAVRLFTQKINEKRRAAGDARSLRAGDMNAMGLIDEVLHYVTRLYVRQKDPRAFGEALEFLDARLGRGAVDSVLQSFLREFPPLEVFDGAIEVEQYLAGETDGVSHREMALEEILHLWLANGNPAFTPFIELFDQAPLAASPGYSALIDALEEFFRPRPPFGPDNQNLIALLSAPVAASPRSLTGQLEFIRIRWGYMLGDLLSKLLTGIDLIKEEERLRFAFFKPGPPEVYEYAGQWAELEAFSADKDWMPKVVMLAKNALVWLDQLSRRFGRAITRLDQVPDEELDRLARSGFTALWLIGVWERSGASRRIKRTMGNQEAEASAYSLFDYEVARELGGEGALGNLRERAWRRGIRLASDMVPNHTGIDSRWMIEHPDRFLGYPKPYPPFPSYSFNGPNLMEDPRVGVFLEDHYYSRSDASVVFKRVDFHTGDSRYIYHGNDGTHMPWNDTAQLDFLNPETREAVIRTILHVASLFPIIRFDAAMTLTKKHFQRLWFPEPGRGGDIPSRAECGISRFDFDRAMPKEFWREVVDRVASEVPDTLLLAEAFWLLEGFFVRTLGMHRVYNSAFMNMLKTEDNAGYRQTVKNTLEFDPEVLKRFVNFMSNPDEDTAIAQFGDGDKYFGVCALMSTMPGLPMFAHGQLEGFKEKYGMEFRCAYWNESANGWLMDRHEREIFPLLKKRYLFCGVENFLLYDFYDPAGWVNEDVFAYSNRCGAERALVLFNNRYREARGWIRVSVAFAVKKPEGKSLEQRQLGDGLALCGADGVYTIFRDHVKGLEYIRNSREIREMGMFASLAAFQYQVFLDFREVTDDAEGRWGRLAMELKGGGVPSMDEAFREMDLRPVYRPFAALVNADMINKFVSLAGEKGLKSTAEADGRGKLLEEVQHLYREFLSAAIRRSGAAMDEGRASSDFAALGRAVIQSPREVLPVLWAWAVLEPFSGSNGNGGRNPAVSWLDEWRLGRAVRDCCADSGWDSEAANRSSALVAVLLENGGRRLATQSLGETFRRWEAESFLRVNEFQGARWFHKESLETALRALIASAAAESKRLGSKPGEAPAPSTAVGVKDRAFIKSCLAAAESSGFKWDDFLQALAQAAPKNRTVKKHAGKKPGSATKKKSAAGAARSAADASRSAADSKRPRAGTARAAATENRPAAKAKPQVKNSGLQAEKGKRPSTKRR